MAPERDNWTGKLDFMMSCISYAVGLGNIWRFPYICYKNGGAVFLIPYLTFLTLCGLPLFFLEVSYGQFASLSPITVWKLSPLFKGIGFGMVIISGIVCIYYNVIITWALYYLFKSMAATLPWSNCANSWNTPRCSSYPNYSMPNDTTTEAMTTFLPVTPDWDNNTENLTARAMKKVSASEEFWENHVLELSPGIDYMNGIRWELFGCLAFSWVLVFLILIKGVRSSGKVMYFTASFPYIVLFCMLIRAVTLPGAEIGVKFYVIPQWEKLLSLKVWGEAAMQIFYSVGAAWGAIITMASYNKFNNNCYRDALIVPCINCGTSIFAGFVIFSILGFMAQETQSTVDDVITKGPGLVFVVYPEAIAKLPVPQLWSILFFLMIISVGIGSQVGMFQTVTSAVMDEYPGLRHIRGFVTAALCTFAFLMGIPCITRGGIYYLQIMDWYSSTFSLMILSVTECLVIAWIYGVDRFFKDIELMIGFQPCRLWKYMWKFVTPAMILFVLLFSIIQHSPVEYGDEQRPYKYPEWSIGVGWMFALCSILPLPILAIIQICQETGPVLERIKKLVKHTDDWGPADMRHRQRFRRSLTGTEGNEKELEALREEKSANGMNSV